MIIFTNESEMRPCGGFFTAIGKSNSFPFGLTFNNIYELKNIQKQNIPEKLKTVSNTYNFWDSGINEDINICNASVKSFYNEFISEDEKIENIFLVNYYALEQIISVLGIIDLDNFNNSHKDNLKISDTNVFRILSENAANIDRHNLEAINNRKQILKPFFKQLIQKTIINPQKWRLLSTKIDNLIIEGDIFIPGYSKNIFSDTDDLGVIEWNLGGAKTSRFLQKKLDIFVQEIRPNNWVLKGELKLLNTMGIAEPFGQSWKGGVEILIPDFIGKNIWISDLEIKNGDSFVKKFEFSFQKEGFEKISVFSSRGQELDFSGIVSVFPQQQILESNGEIKDFIVDFDSSIRNGKKEFYWQSGIDIQKPFLTFHTLVFWKNLPDQWQQNFFESDFLVEIHTNEKIKDIFLKAELKDLQTNIILENRKLRKFEKISENAYLLAFEKNTQQLEEKFNLEINGLEDLWGNVLNTKNYTIIEREE